MTASEWRKSSYSANGDCVEVSWRKSSYSDGGNGCVEIGWRKSTHSAGANGCVEIGWPEAGVAVRDSKNQEGPVLSFPTGSWQEFLR